jgi:hypothetical protein
LIVVLLLTMLSWVGGQVAYLVSGTFYDELEMVVAISAMLYVVFWLVSGIVSLFWIYGVARNAKALRPALGVTPRMGGGLVLCSVRQSR